MLIQRNSVSHDIPNPIDHNNSSGLGHHPPCSHNLPPPSPAYPPPPQKTQLQCSSRSPSSTNHHTSPYTNSSQPSLPPSYHCCLSLPRSHLPPFPTTRGNFSCFYTRDPCHIPRHNQSVLESWFFRKGLTISFRANMGHPQAPCIRCDWT